MLIDDSTPEPAPGRAPVEPNWRLVGWLALGAVLGFTALSTTGLVAYLLLCGSLGALCKAAVQAVPNGDGLREWRQ